MNKKIDPRKVRDFVKDLLKKGKSKQEVYEELIKKYNNRNQVADILRFIPSIERNKKYGIWNTIYLIYLSIFLLITIVIPTIGTTVFFLLALLIALKKFEYYYWNTIFGVVTLILYAIIIAIAGTYFKNDGPEERIMHAFVIFNTLIFIYAGIFLPKILTPKYIKNEERYKDDDGKERIRVIHVFDD
jgi:hypothetical protein